MIEVPCTLCAPDQEKSCFACCPPIRPAGYEHFRYTNEIKRILRENTASFKKGGKSVSPITGFSCWALGYLDRGYKRIGCLLHPSQNDGKELRFRVDYGHKCTRESCVEAEIFARLAPEAKYFWLQLSEGFDSFSYSSRTLNPLFRILGWGSPVLNLVAVAEKGQGLCAESVFEIYPFFKTPLLPRANAYLLRMLIDPKNLHYLKNPRFKDRFEQLSRRLSRRVSQEPRGAPGAPYVHLLPMDPDFLDFLRLSGGIVKAGQEEATWLKQLADHELEQFHEGFSLF